MGEASVGRIRLPTVASALMILLGLLTLNFVDVYAGIAIMLLGVAMYLVYRRATRSRRLAGADVVARHEG